MSSRQRNWRVQRPRRRKSWMCSRNSKEARVTGAEGERVESSPSASLLGQRAEIKSSWQLRAGPDTGGGQRRWSDAVMGQQAGDRRLCHLPSFPLFRTVAVPSPLSWLLRDTLLRGTVGQLGWGDMRDAGVEPRRGQGQHSWGARHHLQLIFLCHFYFL